MNIKKGDKIVIILAVLLIAAGLVIRIGFKSGGIGSIIAKTKRVNLVFTQLRESEWEENTVSSLIEEYERLNPAVSIRRQSQSYDELRDATATTVAPTTVAPTTVAPTTVAPAKAVAEADTAGADIIVMEGRYLAEFIKAGTFSSLDSRLRSDTPFGEWVLPLVSSMDVLFYNIDILKAAGFDKPPGNRAEFLRYAQAVSGGKGIDADGRGIDSGGEGEKYAAAIALSPTDSRGVYRDVFSWIWAAGVHLTSDNEPKFSGKQINETLAFLAQLQKEGLLAPQSFAATGAERLDEFAAGKIAMMTGSVRDIAKVREGMKDGSFGITLIPGPEDYVGKPVFGLSTWYAGVGTGSEHPDEAGAFLLYLRENSGTIAEQIRAVPGNNDAAAPYITADPFYAKARDMYEAADLVEELTAFPKVRELENAVREELEKMFADNTAPAGINIAPAGINTTPADTAAAIQKRWE